MPSHVTHLLFAEACCSDARLPEALAPPSHPFLALGAQGPDIFYHNQRRKPSGLTYGSLMHRHGYGRTVAGMASWAWSQGLALGSWAGAWIVGFATHAILDRFTHPFINCFSGWVSPGDPHTEQFRSMHPFLERLIDVAMLRSERGIHPNELDFAKLANCGEQPPETWMDLMQDALSGAYRVASGDTEIRDRLHGAYLDATGYYRFTNFVDSHYMREALAREKRGEIGERWLSIVHPPEIPGGLDVLNLGHAEWVHPCDETERSTSSFVDLYEAARRRGVEVLTTIAKAWNDATAGLDERRGAVENAVGNWNLSDGRDTERACRKEYARPLPLREAQSALRASITNDD